MNLGIDFGSTYTISSTYRAEHEKLEALELDSGQANVNVPSIVSRRDDKLRFGTSGKRQTGKNQIFTYKAFKMLLNENNQDLIEERLYDNTYSPKWAATQFLNYVITQALKITGDARVDNLVLGAPDVWFQTFDTFCGRTVLKDICSSIENVEKKGIQIISEPVLAGAYFAYNYMKKLNKAFQGNILIIDYGGGTLDLSLAKVDLGVNGAMEISMLESNGAGENTDHTVGNAGIIYMESLMEYAIKKNTPDLAEDLVYTPEFYAAVNQLEEELFTLFSEIETVFEEIGTEYIEDLEEEILTEEIECGGESYTITYADMLTVYNKIIRDVLEEKMDEMIQWAKEIRQINLLKSDGDKLKIALVGGFGNFYLVRKQVKEKFRFLYNDDREKHIIENIQDRERAISYGAALIASNVLGVRSTAPISIGIVSHLNGIEQIDYMAQYRQEIEVGKPYYIKEKDGEDKVFLLGQNELKDFVIDYGRANNKSIRFTIKEEFRKHLSGLVKNIFHACAVGVSFGNSDMLSLHIKEFYFDSYPQRFADTASTIDLGNFKEVFEEIK